MADVGTNDGPLVLREMIATLAVGGIFIFARTITRTVIKPQFGWDDALIIITWLIILGYNSAMFVSISRGYGMHVDALSTDQYVSTVEAEVIGQVMAIAAFPTGKASVAYLLLRIFPGQKLRWFLWTFVVFNAIFFYIDAILVIVQCQPVAFQWDHSIPGGSCWDSKVVIVWGYITGVFGAITDFSFALLPWYYISKLQMDLKVKIGVGVALSMGFFAGVCSILKIYYTSRLGAHSDYSFDTVPLVLWSCAELAAINVAACIPALGPLLQFVGSAKSQYFKSDRSQRSPSEASTIVSPTQRFPLQTPERSEFMYKKDGHDRNIYQCRTYNVSVHCREDDESEIQPGNRTTVSSDPRTESWR